MAPAAIACTRCRTPLPPEQLNRPTMTPCPGCGAGLVVAAFPALLDDQQAPRTGERLLAGNQASCFYHGGKKAFSVCQRCGRFLCQLCDIDLGDESLCPACVEAAVERDSATELDVTRRCYDGLALRLALVPIPVTVLASLVLAAMHWRKRDEIVPQTHSVWIAAVGIAVAQLAVWVVLGWALRP